MHSRVCAGFFVKFLNIYTSIEHYYGPFALEAIIIVECMKLQNYVPTFCYTQTHMYHCRLLNFN